MSSDVYPRVLERAVQRTFTSTLVKPGVVMFTMNSITEQDFAQIGKNHRGNYTYQKRTLVVTEHNFTMVEGFAESFERTLASLHVTKFGALDS